MGSCLHWLITKCTGRDPAADDVHAVVDWVARFNWHRDLILALLRRRDIARLLFRALFR